MPEGKRNDSKSASFVRKSSPEKVRTHIGKQMDMTRLRAYEMTECLPASPAKKGQIEKRFARTLVHTWNTHGTHMLQDIRKSASLAKQSQIERMCMSLKTIMPPAMRMYLGFCDLRYRVLTAILR